MPLQLSVSTGNDQSTPATTAQGENKAMAGKLINRTSSFLTYVCMYIDVIYIYK